MDDRCSSQDGVAKAVVDSLTQSSRRERAAGPSALPRRECEARGHLGSRGAPWPLRLLIYPTLGP